MPPRNVRLGGAAGGGLGGWLALGRGQGQQLVSQPLDLQIGMPRRGGSILGQDGREAVLKPDDMVLSDSARPLTLVMEERFDWEVFLLPKPGSAGWTPS